MTNSELLIAYGFVKKDIDSSKYKGDNPLAKRQFIERELNKLKGKEKTEYLKQLQEDADHDELEFAKNQLMLVDYPKPLNKYNLLTESFHQSIEPLYFWSLNHMRDDLAFGWVEKITDIFSASEHSSFWGAATSRLGLSQDKVQGYMALIGQFIRKDLFQLVRDIRWVDERLDYHRASREGKEDAMVVLKGIWSDVVDGVVQGQRTGANVFQLANQLNYRPLADLFFYTNPKTPEEVEAAVDALDTTKPIKSILKRKLQEFMTWREHNFKELQTRRTFEIKYLRQHYNIVKMYMNWIKPYLTHIERLRSNVNNLKGPELIASFEGSMIEIEIAGMKLPEGNSDVYAVMVLTFEYRTRPQMGGAFTQRVPGHHEGPVHVGQTHLTWRAYAWTAEEIENFKRMKEREDLELLKSIDSGIKESMDAIGDSLWEYLAEAGEDIPQKEDSAEDKKEQPKRPPAWQPITDIGKGFNDLYRAFKPSKKDKPKDGDLKKERETAETEAAKMLYTHYKNFKKSHGMTHW